jgi:HEPN domain-containing protein
MPKKPQARNAIKEEKPQAGGVFKIEKSTLPPIRPERSDGVIHMTSIKNAPLAQKYRFGATECLNAARGMEAKNSIAQYILSFHALELALKSYLAQKGLSGKKLKDKYGHDLEKLYKKAKEFELKNDNVDIAKWAGEYHAVVIRYDFAGFKFLPNSSKLFEVINAILQQVPEMTMTINP